MKIITAIRRFFTEKDINRIGVQEKLNTWTCHGCGERRQDKYIDVASFPIRGLPGAERNMRFCNDRPSCYSAILKKVTD